MRRIGTAAVLIVWLFIALFPLGLVPPRQSLAAPSGATLRLRPARTAAESEDPLRDFVSAVKKHTDALQDSFVIQVGEELKEVLLSGSGLYSGDSWMLSEILENCGVFSYRVFTMGQSLGLVNIRYYAGVRILHAYRNDRIASLDSREKAALAEALRIVSMARGTALEKERMIHDALCERITYFTDDEAYDEKDCAVGALLNGLADCDGYSDAFYLCCNLAGIPTLHQVGNVDPSLFYEVPDWAGGAHMWNLVQLDGVWVGVDVTWDDRNDSVFHMYYNIGSAQLGETHRWSPQAMAVVMEEESPNALRDPDLRWYTVSDWDGLYSLLVDLSARRPERVCLRMPPEMNPWKNANRLGRAVFTAAVIDFSWDLTKTGAELSVIEYPDEFGICANEEEVLSYIEDRAREDCRKYRVYFAPELSKRLFADHQRNLSALLVRTRLKNPFGFAAGEEAGMIVFKNAQYVDRAAELVTVRSWDEVYAALAANSRTRTERLAIAWPGSDELKENSGELSTLVNATGVRSFSWTLRKGVAFLYDLEYYPGFAICSSEAEVADYLGQCAAARSGEIRIYCASRELYDILHQNSSARFYELLRDAGCESTALLCQDECRMLLVEAPLW